MGRCWTASERVSRRVSKYLASSRSLWPLGYSRASCREMILLASIGSSLRMPSSFWRQIPSRTHRSRSLWRGSRGRWGCWQELGRGGLSCSPPGRSERWRCACPCSGWRRDWGFAGGRSIYHEEWSRWWNQRVAPSDTGNDPEWYDSIWVDSWRKLPSYWTKLIFPTSTSSWLWPDLPVSEGFSLSSAFRTIRSLV